MNVRRLTRDEARRIAVRAQLLDAPRPRDLLSTLDRLTFVQLDPTAVIAPSADLIAWSRLGGRYQPVQLQRALESDRTVFEHRAQPVVIEPPLAMVRPMADLGLYLAEMASFGGRRHIAWLATNEAFRRRVLDLLASAGPLTSREIPDTAEVPWASTGWTNQRNVTQMLELLASRGEVAVAGRRGRERLWDLAERVYPADLVVVPADEARRIRDERWLRSFGLARPKAVGDAGVPVEIEGVAGEWRLDPDATGEGFEGRTALLSPFDRLIHDRTRALEIFGFEYALEMYKPKGQRRWGYFALPVLHHDQLVGKIDASADRKLDLLRVDAIHEDLRFTGAMSDAIEAELEALATWLGLAGVSWPARRGASRG